jgi:hypothetical protein
MALSACCPVGKRNPQAAFGLRFLTPKAAGNPARKYLIIFVSRYFTW